MDGLNPHLAERRLSLTNLPWMCASSSGDNSPATPGMSNFLSSGFGGAVTFARSLHSMNQLALSFLPEQTDHKQHEVSQS